MPVMLEALRTLMWAAKVLLVVLPFTPAATRCGRPPHEFRWFRVTAPFGALSLARLQLEAL